MGYSEEQHAQILLDKYNKFGNTIEIIREDNFESTLLGELPDEYIKKRLKRLNGRKSIYPLTWCFIYNDVLLKRRIKKIETIKNHIN